MTETLHTPVRPYGADSPFAHLLDIAAQTVGAPSEDEQRDEAETAAAHHLYNDFPYSLAQVVDAIDWRGYPAVREAGQRLWEASAVAWLDGGLWLHHTLRSAEDDGASDVLTLIVPCTCGRGYTDITLDCEDLLMEILAELRPTHGRSVHHAALLDCASVPAASSAVDDPEGKADLEMQALDAIRG
ncbi:hypothetical protein ACFYW9_37360 [Streptomyces sp. NPDC002698]|uniref:hypothetical protein n=1 Tax=Streptomyces sp. NPDC002698 TaxID=3364660 RepID=UPI0036C31171